MWEGARQSSGEETKGEETKGEETKDWGQVKFLAYGSIKCCCEEEDESVGLGTLDVGLQALGCVGDHGDQGGVR